MDEMVTSLSLFNPFRVLHPHRKLFTNIRSLNQSGGDRRLDRFYLSRSLLPLAQGQDLWARPTSPSSSHHPIVLRVAVPGVVECGEGTFKVGVHVLRRAGVVDLLKHKIRTTHPTSTSLHPHDPLAAWDLTKAALTLFLRDLSRRFARFDRTNPSPESDRISLDGQALRARLDAGDASEFAVRMRLKQVRRTDVITSLRSFDGSTSSYSPGELFDTSTQFYSHLYRHKPTTPPDHERPLSFIDNSLSPSAQQRLEEPFDMDELATAAFKSSRGKTPGVDGLPSEFYKLTWSETGPILLEILNQTAITGRLSSSQSIAQFHLIYKKGDKDDIRNYRPIALINTDARIISGAINSRLLEQIHLVVHPDQTAFIPNRWIGSNIAQLQSLVDEEKTHPGIIAQVDFEKAYDNVSHDFIEPCLRKMGFGTRFINTIKSTYSHQFGRICLNGWVGESFPLLSGVRQGNSRTLHLLPRLRTSCCDASSETSWYPSTFLSL